MEIMLSHFGVGVAYDALDGLNVHTKRLHLRHIRSRIFALGSLRVGHKHLAADLYRFIGISATPSAL